MKKSFISFLFLALVFFGFSSCEVDIEEGPNNSSYATGTINAGELDTKGFTVKTILETVNLGNGKFSVLTYRCDLPQIISVNNTNGEPVLLYRDLIPKKGTIEINARTTAIALITFRPDMGVVFGDEYAELVSLITSSSHFDDFLSEVEQSIASNRFIYDTTNEKLISALGDVLRDLMGDESRLFACSSNKAPDSNLTNTYGCWPIDVQADGTSLRFRLPGLCPSFYCKVYNTEGGLEKTFVIRTRDNYGVLNAVRCLMGQCDWLYGETKTYTFPKVNDQREFFITRNDPVMIGDNCLQIAQCMLQLLGVPLEGGLVTRVSDYLNAFIAANYAGVANFNEAIWTMFPLLLDATLDCLTEAGIEMVAGFAKNMIIFNKVVNGLEGVGNLLARVVWNMITDTDFSFCAQCYSNNDFGICKGKASLRIKSGNNQNGNPNTELRNPLSVELVTSRYDDIPVEYYMVRFEVASGNGHISQHIVSLDENGIASTNWTLGSSGNTQTVNAILFDYVHDINLDTVTFTATLEKEEWLLKDRCEWADTYIATLRFDGSEEFGPTTVYGYDYDGSELKKVWSGYYNSSSGLLRLQIYTTSKVSDDFYRIDVFEGYLTGDNGTIVGTLIESHNAGCNRVIDFMKISSHTTTKNNKMTDSSSTTEGCGIFRR